MKMKLIMAAAATCLLLPAAAFAQTACPTGVNAGSAQCGPAPGSGGGGYSEPQEIKPGGYFRTAFYAVAVSSQMQSVTPVVNKVSRDEAEIEALDQCAASGAPDCGVIVSGYNKCFAIVGVLEGDLYHSAQEINMNALPSSEGAMATAMRRCEQDKGSGVCSVVWRGCSRPVWATDLEGERNEMKLRQQLRREERSSRVRGFFGK
ncbi:DUF4189 domain-containing protein [Stenotrophomonas ginsengisoli]|uniref:DUF4189 domain-containing protein n=1 Tax=Stenotrophomonas ginsengisoli TaxID=336566 RepID=UPI0009F8DA7E|nr:DUF4189 domain-containing protein [Stenotrophomonas ginsengisoli]